MFNHRPTYCSLAKQKVNLGINEDCMSKILRMTLQTYNGELYMIFPLLLIPFLILYYIRSYYLCFNK